jgi:ATP-dependent DNA ligase
VFDTPACHQGEREAVAPVAEQLPVVEAGLGGTVRVCGMTPDHHLRHASFVALWEDRDAREVRRKDDAR